MALRAAEVSAEAEKRRERAERRKERRAFQRKHSKAFLCLYLFLFLVVTAGIGIWVYGRLIPVGYDVEDLTGRNYEDVYYVLIKSGFTNIDMIPTEDLSMGRIEEEGIVYQVTVFGQTEFKASSKLPYDAKITIRYHAIKPVQVPVSSKNCKDSISLILDSGECFVGDLEPMEYLDAYEQKEELKRDWELIMGHAPKVIYYAHANHKQL